MSGRLVLCATPIGNLGDVSARLVETLSEADVVLAEDTRRSRILLDHCGIKTRPESYFAGNEAGKSDRLAGLLQSEAVVALITDAGMPAVSDPGSRAVQVAREVGAQVSVIPGPSAVLAAVAVSGFAAARFCFEGFLPRKGADRSKRLQVLAHEERTVVLFAAPHRLAADLTDLAKSLGEDRMVCVARELTKHFEEVWWGRLAEAVQHWTDGAPRGEFTLVVEGGSPREVSLAAAVEEALTRIGQGVSLSDAVRETSQAWEVGRRVLYQAVLDARSGEPG